MFSSAQKILFSAQKILSSAQKNGAMAATIMWRIEIIKIMSKSIIILPTLIFISSGKNKNKEKLYNPIAQIKDDSIGIILNNKNNLVKWIYSFRNGEKKN